MSEDNKPTLEEFRGHYTMLMGCCLRPAPFAAEDVDEIVEWYGDGIGDTDRTSASLLRLTDGRWATHEDSEDYTGHGCQCGASADVYPDRETAVRLGLSQWARDSK